VDSIDAAVGTPPVWKIQEEIAEAKRNCIFYGIITYVSKTAGIINLTLAAVNGIGYQLCESFLPAHNPFEGSGAAWALWISCGLVGYLGSEGLDVSRELGEEKIVKISKILDDAMYD